MDLDDLKQAVRGMESRLEQVRALSVDTYKERKIGLVRASLRPLLWGHVAQVAFGIALAFSVGPFWWNHRAESSLMVAGVALHVYAVLMIALGARVLVLLHTLDFAAPVLEIQKQLTLLRRSYVTTSLAAGLPWWLLWMPLMMVLSGVDLVAHAPAAWVIGNVAVGIAGIVVTLWFFRHLWRRSDPERARALEDASAGGSLRRAQRFLEEIAVFERE